MLNRKTIVLSILTLTMMTASCSAPPVAQAPAAKPAESKPAETKPTDVPKAAEVKPTDAPKQAESPKAADIVTWYQYDEKNEDPKNDEAVGNAYLRKVIPIFNKEFEGKLNWVNQPQPWQKMQTSLVAAVLAGGDVPDVMHANAGSLPIFIKNGTVEDLTSWIKEQAWFKDLEPSAVAACTVEGKIYCVPVAALPNLVFYWKDYFPNGFPKTADEFLKQAAELKKKNVHAITYFGNGSAFNGEATGRYFFSTIASFGGGYDDGAGKLKLNRAENIEAIKFMREVVAKGYSSESVFLGDFKEEEDLKGLDPAKPIAASFPTGIFGYRYIQPVKAPSGKQYGKDFDPKGGPMLEAIAAGDMQVSSMFVGGSAKSPSCHLGVTGFVIPKGAKNPDGAKTYINWVMDPKNGIEWVQKPGGGFPASKVFLQDKAFDTPFYKSAASATAGICRLWQGSLVDNTLAKKIIARTIFDLIKGKDAKTDDIAGVLAKADEEYNKTVN